MNKQPPPLPQKMWHIVSFNSGTKEKLGPPENRRLWNFVNFGLLYFNIVKAVLIVWSVMRGGHFEPSPRLVFRWFKFTLKPPYSGASERSLLAIWTLPIGIFLSIWSQDSLRHLLWHLIVTFEILSTFGDSRAVWVFWPKLGVFRKSKFSRWRSNGASMRLRGFR